MEKSPITKGVQLVPLESWKYFSGFIMDDLSNAPAYIFRGQAHPKWKIESTIDRMEKRYSTTPYFHGDTPKEFNCSPYTRTGHLNAFKEVARGKSNLNTENFSMDEWWALAQHHGLATPMLDWTYSPFVALFFAFEEERIIVGKKSTKPDQRTVFAISSHLVTHKDNEKDINPEVFVSTKNIGPRIGNQAGLFLKMPKECTLESYIQKKFPSESTDGPRRGREILYKINIPDEGRKECLKFLNKMNINRASLFPDLDGASRYINNLWELDGDSLLGYYLE